MAFSQLLDAFISNYMLIIAIFVGLISVKLILDQLPQNDQHKLCKKHNKSSSNVSQSQWRRIKRKKRARSDGKYYLHCMNGTEWGRFYASSQRRNILDVNCLVCGVNDADIITPIQYECDVNDGCWVCSIYCYKKLILREGYQLKPFMNQCYSLYIGYVRDRISGHNICKLNIYQTNYELNLQFLIDGFLSDSINRDIFNDNCIALIISYYNTKITSFNDSLSKNEYLSLDITTNRISQIKQCKYKDVLCYIPSYSTMILSKNNIYYAIIKAVSIESNGFYIGIIPTRHGIAHYLTKSVTNISNVYVYGNNGNCYYNNNSNYGGYKSITYKYQNDDVIKSIIDMKIGLICFINLNKPNNEPIAFKINKYIQYRFIVATCHQYDQYQLL